MSGSVTSVSYVPPRLPQVVATLDNSGESSSCCSTKTACTVVCTPICAAPIVVTCLYAGPCAGTAVTVGEGILISLGAKCVQKCTPPTMSRN